MHIKTKCFITNCVTNVQPEYIYHSFVWDDSKTEKIGTKMVIIQQV